VYKCVARIAKELPVCVKVVPLKDSLLDVSRAEYEILSDLNHKSIARAHGFFVDTHSNKIYTVLERAEGIGLDKHTGFSGEQVKSLFRQLVDAVVYLHERRVCHRDLKPDNVIVNLLNSTLKLIDFNVACKTSTQGLAIGGVGLKEWSAPETRQHLHYNQKSDAWSLGLILAYMLRKQDFSVF